MMLCALIYLFLPPLAVSSFLRGVGRFFGCIRGGTNKVHDNNDTWNYTDYFDDLLTSDATMLQQSEIMSIIWNSSHSYTSPDSEDMVSIRFPFHRIRPNITPIWDESYQNLSVLDISNVSDYDGLLDISVSTTRYAIAIDDKANSFHSSLFFSFFSLSALNTKHLVSTLFAHSRSICTLI